MCNMSQAVSAIVATAQVADQLLVFVFGRTYALALAPRYVLEWDEFSCDAAICAPRDEDCLAWANLCVPFGQSPLDKLEGVELPIVFTLGYFLSLLAFAPLGTMALDDNIKFQIFSFVLQSVLILEFCVHFLFWEKDAMEPLAFVGDDTSNVLGVAVFNFALCMTVPSWMNEKRTGVSVNKVIWTSMGSGLLTFVLFGILGGLATHHPKDNIANTLAAAHNHPLTRLSAFLFGVIIIGLGIPVSCVVVRYNLQVGRVLPPSLAMFCSAVLPWLISWPMYQGHAALDLISWSGMIVNGLVNGVLPLLLALSAAGYLYLRAPICPAHTSDVAPLPPLLEPYRTPLILLLLGLAIPSIAIATGLKTYEQLHADNINLVNLTAVSL